MKAYGGMHSSTICDLGGESSASRPGRFTLGKLPPVHIGQEAGQASEPVWTLCGWENLANSRIRTPAIHPIARRRIDWTIPTPQLLF
jgi:hypothetical protein